MRRATDSHDAGMKAHDAGLPRDTYTSDFWITRAAWLAGWDQAADLKANPPASWDDVAVSLPVKAATIHDFHAIAMYTGRTLYRGADKREALDACRRNGRASSLLLCDGAACNKRTGIPLAR